MRNTLFALAFVLSGASCFNPDLTGITFTCDPPLSGDCPNGLACNSQGICATSGDSDGGITNTDMAGTTGTVPQLGPAEGCPMINSMPGQGYMINLPGKPVVYACPVKFTNTAGQTADMQCKSGYTLCGSATNIDLAACTKVGQSNTSYFISSVPAKKDGFPRNTVSCGAAGNGQSALWAGCGRTTNVTSITCESFPTALACGQGNLTCGGQGRALGDAINNDSASGVLCCHP